MCANQFDSSIRQQGENEIIQLPLKRKHKTSRPVKQVTSVQGACVQNIDGHGGLVGWVIVNAADSKRGFCLERGQRGHFAEITFIGINSADIKEHKKIDKVLKVTVDFVSEIITCIRDKEKKIVSGSPDKIKKIYDTWTFSRDMSSNNPNWLLVNTLN